ncbi:histidine kinase [uncultured Dialister sp.]|uniref:histidine kinase n=1 Tax=uncultured Dialister sp. TaxID=278064 RepID=UPI0026008CD3|nr:histidine kinase [uncultured Dialister sp.]
MAEEKRVNLKAQKFEQYTKANKLDYFVKNPVHDEADTVVFQSQIQVEGQRIPMGIITDSTIYTIIRVQVGSGLVKESNKNEFLEYLNALNRSYKVFKYVAADDGSVFLDACLPSTNESFDPEIVRVVLDVVVDHLNSEYKNIMKKAWV